MERLQETEGKRCRQTIGNRMEHRHAAGRREEVENATALWDGDVCGPGGRPRGKKKEKGDGRR